MEKEKVTKTKYEIGTTFKKDDQVGVLVTNGITKTLKLEDGKEITVSPAEFKTWEFVKAPEVVEESVDAKVDETPSVKEVSDVKEKTRKTKKVVKSDEKPQGHLKWKEFAKYMSAHNEEDDITGVIVFTQENFGEEYSLESRSYRVKATASCFDKHNGLSNALIGSALDDSDPNIRLDKYGWEIEYCYVE